MSRAKPAPADRRVARTSTASADTSHKKPGEWLKEQGERTRRRIADAALELLEEGERPPTADEIADRAGVSHRLLFHHFDGLDELYDAVAAILIDRYRHDVAEVSPDPPRAERIDRTVQQRARLYHSMGHLGLNAAVLSARHLTVADGVVRMHEDLRSRLERTFSPEIDDAGNRRHEVLSAIDAAVSWQIWDYLRRVNGLSGAATRRIMTKMLRAALRSP